MIHQFSSHTKYVIVKLLLLHLEKSLLETLTELIVICLREDTKRNL